jgi:hypothetical protein
MIGIESLPEGLGALTRDLCLALGKAFANLRAADYSALLADHPGQMTRELTSIEKCAFQDAATTLKNAGALFADGAVFELPATYDNSSALFDGSVVMPFSSAIPTPYVTIGSEAKAALGALIASDPVMNPMRPDEVIRHLTAISTGVSIG